MTSADLVALLKKHPIGFGCALLGIACGAVLYLRSGNLAASQAELEAKSAEVAKMTANIRNSSNLPDQVAEIQALTKEFEGRLLKASQLAVNLQYFYKLETENEVKLIDVRQGSLPKNAKTIYQGVPFIVSVQGTYVQVMNFLNRLQNGRHFCRINTTNFTKTAVAGTSGSLVNLSITLDLLGQP
jgi:Tfp pilus assembly protein PilO